MSSPFYPATVNPAVRAGVRRVMELGGEWSLRLDPSERGAREGWNLGDAPFETSVPVPGCVNVLAALAAEYPSHTMPNAYEGGCWYRRRFDLPADWQAERTWLLFGGIMPAGHVWLNDRYLGYHPYSPVAVKFDATAALRRSGPNVVTVELPWRDLGFRGGLIFGPGLWRTVELEGTASLRIESLFIRPRPAERRAIVTATVFNDGPSHRQVAVRAAARPTSGRGTAFESSGVRLSVPAGGSTPVTLTLAMPGARPWTPEDPFLYALTLTLGADGATVDAVAERFGLREVTVGKDSLLLNGEPLMFRAVCDEFFGCPTVAPIVDPALIRRRIAALQKLGFNAKRFHTHLPTREEWDVCDEMGLLVHAEISVISNFNRTEPYPANREVWRAALREFRNHAALATYCMGNEGSQIMDGLYDRVREYYADAKALAPDTPVLAASGMQGEHPMPNDYETPHFWSRYFVWAYDGLTALPWRALDPLAAKGPLVIHEYGKFTVWPDPKEDRYFRDAGLPLKGNYGAMGRIALKEAGLERLLPKVIRNSRALAAVCNKLVIEEARRPPRVSGYHVLSAFRLNCNRGMVDDLGQHIDPEFRDYALANAPTALLIDRSFRGRTLVAGQEVALTVHLSHFGPARVAQARLRWRLADAAGTHAEGAVRGLNFPRGRNGPLCTLAFRAPPGTGRCTLTMELLSRGATLALNRWDFWHFAWPEGRCPDVVVSAAADPAWELDLMAAFPAIRRLDDFVSMWKGDRICKAPTGREDADYLTAHPVTALIADHWNEGFAAYVKRGGSVLLLNTGHFPERWYAPREPRDKAYGAPHITFDMYTLFAPFRTGWDHGNAATLIARHPVLKGFPHAGFCDLQCFAMVQGAKTLRTAELPGRVRPVIRVIPMWRRSGPQAGPSPDRPDVPRPYQTEDRVYLAECRIGKGRVLISSLRHFAEPAGRWLLERLVGHVSARQHGYGR